MNELRPYQQQLVADLRVALRQHKRVLAVAPTGSGKTQCFSDIAHRAAAGGRRVLILVHRRELLWQARARLGACSPLIEVYSIQAVRNKYLHHPDLLIVDEAHHCTARTWREVLDAWPVPTLGFSATPQRLDGKGLGDLFGAMVQGPTVADLMTAGYLSPYRLFCPPGKADVSGIKKRGGDFAKNELAERVDQRRVMACAIKNWRLYAGNRRTIGFCVSLAHADHVRDMFAEAGVAAATIDGSMPASDRDAVLARFRSGEVRVLLSVDLISEGFDVPACDCVMLMRPTASLGLYLQQVGRALRPSSRDAVILDCVGNAETHGLPDDDRGWSLDGIAKERKGQVQTVPIRVCGRCYGVHKPAPVCPYCGNVHAVEVKIPIEQDVVLVDKTEEMRNRRREVGAARRREDLEAIAAARGYKPNWVMHVLKSRRDRR